MIKRMVKAAIATPLGWRAYGLARGGGVSVLMYHRITRRGDPFPGTDLDDFARQMRWLSRNCRPIAPEEFDSALSQPATARPAVLVTFDDGYRDYHDNAYPVLAELKIPAAVFLATSFMDRGGMIWTDAVAWAANHSRQPHVALPWDRKKVFALSSDSDRARLASACKGFLKDQPDAERQRWQAALFAELKVDADDGSAGRQMLTWDEVRATMEHTRYGGHTHTHPILSQVSVAQAEQEIGTCRDRIRDETGRAPRYFAYPNGRAQDFNEDTRAILIRNGFDLGFSTIEGVHRRGMDRYAIRRQPTGGRTIGDFAWLVAGH